jgi:hypothetical protein
MWQARECGRESSYDIASEDDQSGGHDLPLKGKRLPLSWSSNHGDITLS